MVGMFPTTGCPAEPTNERCNAMKRKANAEKVPAAGKNKGTAKKNGKVLRKRFADMVGMKCETPATTYPRLERNGVAVVFDPAFDRDGKHAGWTITVHNPVADALAAADNALAFAMGRTDTADLWRDLIPTYNTGGECLLMLGCSAATIQAFVRQAKRNGFKAIADDPAETKGGAE